MQKAYQKSEHEIYLENEAGERIAEILFPEVEPKVYCIQRTFVDDSLRGQGVATVVVGSCCSVVTVVDSVVAGEN